MNGTARLRLLRLIHAKARSLGLDAEDRRDWQRGMTGKASCRDMSLSQLKVVVAALDARPPGDRLPDGGLTRKLRALWISGCHLGVVRDRGDAALAAFVRRATGLDAVRWINDPASAMTAVEALKGLLAREAGVDWSANTTDNPRARVLEAQERILALRGVADPWTAVGVDEDCIKPFARLRPAEADALIRAFGEQVRAAEGHR